ncbi:flagellar basal-body MS-ring/collar protein FliF [Cellulomonas wangsupingiae]|uniref:Flagellar M-ring protein n=1 Tax=Cellulomonas wangsupingiae TaxID=2968085 RepID=A0ABY5K7P3_9CELL|nr:flagellar basal-body MS-ring/collar protein FliF [Cellulomonas wangsupingiae]MCC2334150.1 flagellar M-ring protein FliF [Cellulomonas wangsupingiae]UUI65829.1 flagellar M-ring protein FliF [Cellulomonas wangsupingiae]
MPAQVQDAWGRLTGAARQLTLAQRTFAVIAVAALVLGAIALTSWLSRPALVPLFSGLGGADASAVVDELTAAGVAYELTDGGATIMVPAAVVYEQRVRLAAAGLPADTDGAGYSLLDQMPMTASEFQQETTYRRALEGELSRTVAAIDGVEAATVRLAIPEETVFVAEAAAPTASVFVRTRPGARLSGDQVQAVTQLVAAGVDGMETSDVAVVDASGAVLSAVGAEVGGALADSRTADHEARVGGAVQAMLDRLVGAGRATVTVNAVLDLSQSERTTEEFTATPDTPPLAASTTTEEYTGTGGAGATGVLGPDAVDAGEDGTRQDGTYSSTSEDVTNAVNKSTEVTRSAPGALQRQSVSVLVDQQAAGGLVMADLEAAVAAAAGIDTERGDTLSVQRMQFDTTSAQAAQEALAAADERAEAVAREGLLREVVIAAAIVLLVVIVLVVVGRRSRRARREALDLGELERARQLTLALTPLDGPEPEALPALPAPVAPAPPDATAVRRAEIATLADEQPEQVAELLRGWMTTGARR